VKAADERTTKNANATTRTWRRSRRGAEADLYHGWNDPAFSALKYDQLFPKCSEQDGRGRRRTRCAALHGAGMLHCGGGPGPDSFGRMARRMEAMRNTMGLALEQWVEKGIAPSASSRPKKRGAIPA